MESETRGKGSELRLESSPAVGLHVTRDTGSEAVASSILRAQRHGHEVFVVADPDADAETREFAGRLDAMIVESGTMSNGRAPRELVAMLAREAGYPGVIWQNDPSDQLELNASTAALSEATEYCISGVSVEAEPDTDRVVVGIPTYNEEVGIGSVILGASAYADEVVVVDDGSSDRTVEIARAAGATVIEHETNQGKGAALQTLLDHVESMDLAALVLLDGDGQHAPADIPQVLEPVRDGEADLVIGSRYLESSPADETPLYRRFGQKVLDVLTMSSSRVTVTDSQSGFRVLSPAAVASISLSTASFGVESEMIDSAVSEGLEVTEKPIEVRYDGIDGQTQNPLRHGLTVVTFILQLVRDKHPLVFFGVPGLLLLAVGIGYGIDGILVYRATGAFYPAKVLVSGFLTILGTLGLFIGLVLNRIGNMISRLKL